MKKLISLILILCLACMLVPAMAESADVAGDWYLKTMKMGDQEYDAAAMGYNMKISLNADGTGTMEMPGSDPTEASWTMEDGQITVTIDNAPASGSVTADTLTLEAEGQVMVFTREATEAITVANVKAAGSVEEFYGEYSCVYIESDGVIVNLAAIGQAMPIVKLSEGAIEFIPSSDEDAVSAILSVMGITYEYADGALKLGSSLEGADISGAVELLEDGMIKLSLDGYTGPMVLYFAPAAAAEEPAA